METERTTVLEEIGRRDGAELVKLRAERIPQRVGMAVAARYLSNDLAQAALARIERQRADGTLARRIEEAADAPAADALAGILREELAFVVHRARAHGERWADDSLRMEGQADALQARVEHARTAPADPKPREDKESA